ncbi:MAG: hypothetical protein VKL39_14805, partial [Leptolyngbyaceae bacterium]|nr:hypothetical protein [Leptolyngbyaceae bacterium]
QAKNQVQKVRERLKTTREQLKDVRDELEAERHELAIAHARIDDAETELMAMKTSKFWKLRGLWLHFKEAVGLQG